MKLIVRADDVGYSCVNDIGAFETLDKGITTSCDVMLESPGTVGALERLRSYPWISVGWHSHFWGAPLLDCSEVPSLIIPETGRFRHDLHSAMDIDPEELRKECRAQIDRCLSILGRVPDTCETNDSDTSVFKKVQREICKEYGIVMDFASRIDDPNKKVYASDQWKDRKIFIMSPGPAYAETRVDSVTEFQKYDPVKYYTEDRFNQAQFPEDAILEQSWHPGYLDYYMLKEGDYGPNARFFTSCRVVDAHALCSQELKDWIIENKVELVNFRDALYGTREYQNHLKITGSPMYIPV